MSDIKSDIVRPIVTDGEPQLWVGCLACYNEGYLAGFWVDAVHAPTSMTGPEPIAGEGEDEPETDDQPHWNALVNEKATPVSPWHYSMGHEELWVMDHQDFHGLLSGECSPHTGRMIGEAIAAMQADDVEPEAFAAYWVNRHGTDFPEGFEWDAPTRSAFGEAYKGRRDSWKDYVQDLMEELYSEQLEGLPGALKHWIDWDGVARDYDMNGDTWTAPASEGGVHVFDV